MIYNGYTSIKDRPAAP